MKVIATLAVFVYLSGYVAGRDDRLTPDCLNGIANKDECCKKVPGAFFAYLKNPENCATFYQCDNTKAVLKNCALGTHWSVKEDRCEWPDKAGCKKNEGRNEKVSVKMESKIDVPVDNCAPTPICHQCLIGVFPAELCCKDVKTHQKLTLANSKDCYSYYTCINERPVLTQCPKGLHWSTKTERCEWPIDAKCLTITK